MKTLIKRNIAVSLIAATYFGSLISAVAAQSCPGTMTVANMECTLDGASVDDKGVLHCSYSCTVVKPDNKAQLQSFGTRAKAAVARMNVKDPASVKMVNANLKKIHADLEAFAKANNLKLVKKEFIRPTSAKAAQ
jgi:hypothetical protein